MRCRRRRSSTQSGRLAGREKGWGEVVSYKIHVLNGKKKRTLCEDGHDGPSPPSRCWSCPSSSPGHVLERVMASQTRVGAPPLRGLFQESSGCQNPAQEGSDMMRASQERAPLAVG